MANEMAKSEWAALKSHPSKSLPLPNLQRVTASVWSELNALCDLNQVIINVQYDSNLFSQVGYLNTLAVASRTMYLIDDVWTPTAILPRQHNHLSGTIDIRVNPYVPNGWFVDDGLCHIGYNFDLKSVLRHELLHGVGLSSSFSFNSTHESVGYKTSSGNCYPFHMDTKMRTAAGAEVISGCQVLPGKSIKNELYMNNLRIYNPSTHQPGSSFHHIDIPGSLMYYGIPSRQCLYFDRTTVELMNGLGVDCSGTIIGVTSGASAKLNYCSVFILVFMSLKCLMRLLRI